MATVTRRCCPAFENLAIETAAVNAGRDAERSAGLDSTSSTSVWVSVSSRMACYCPQSSLSIAFVLG